MNKLIDKMKEFKRMTIALNNPYLDEKSSKLRKEITQELERDYGELLEYMFNCGLVEIQYAIECGDILKEFSPKHILFINGVTIPMDDHDLFMPAPLEKKKPKKKKR